MPSIAILDDRKNDREILLAYGRVRTGAFRARPYRDVDTKRPLKVKKRKKRGVSR